MTPEAIQTLADKVEADIQGGLSPRPLLSVPHILADESSCYYHGWAAGLFFELFFCEYIMVCRLQSLPVASRLSLFSPRVPWIRAGGLAGPASPTLLFLPPPGTPAPPSSYVLAEMSVHQTRAHFLSTEGRIVDNPNVSARAPRPPALLGGLAARSYCAAGRALRCPCPMPDLGSHP